MTLGQCIIVVGLTLALIALLRGVLFRYGKTPLSRKHSKIAKASFQFAAGAAFVTALVGLLL